MNKIHIPIFHEVDLDDAVNFKEEQDEQEDEEDSCIQNGLSECNDRIFQSRIYDVYEDNSFSSFVNQFWELCEYEEIFDEN